MKKLISDYTIDKGIDIFVTLFITIAVLIGCIYLYISRSDIFGIWIIALMVVVIYFSINICIYIYRRDESKIIKEIEQDIRNDHRVEEIFDNLE